MRPINNLILSAALAVIVSSTLRVGGLAEAAPAASSHEHRPVPPRATARLVREVGHELRMLPYYSAFDNLEYRVDGYRVELQGQVTRPTLKSDAEAVVKRVEGVEAVVNHIEVLPVSIFDDHIRLAEYHAVFSHPAMTRYALQAVPPVHIIVKNGNVTLVGVVATQMDRQIAVMQANSVPGVFSVTDRLFVEKGSGKS